MVIWRAARYALLAVCVLLILCACTNPFYPVYLGNGGGRGDNSGGGGAGGSAPTIPLPLTAGLYLMNAEGTAWEPVPHDSIDPTDTTWYLAQVIAYMSNHHSPRFYGMAVDRNLTVPGATLGNGLKLYIQSTIGQYTITFSIAPTRFIVNSAKLVLQNIHFQGDNNNNSGALVQLNGEAELTMYTGSSIENNRNVNDATSPGGGVYISGNSTFTLDGGTLTGNQADNGGGVYITNGSDFIMKAGSINGGGVANTNSSGNLYGGGVFVDSGSNRFEMSGGSITGNHLVADNVRGGGVYIGGGGSSFVMSGNAEIRGNNAQSTTSTGMALGGGVFNAGTFTMNGDAVIAANNASGGSGSYGGGVCVDPTATFTKTGATTIYGSDELTNMNTAGSSGNAVYINAPKYNDLTAGPGHDLNSAHDGIAGGWN